MQRSGNLYKHNSSVRVRNSNTYGFTLSMNASQPNLVNDKDSTYKIDSVSGTNQQLAANQWGYSMTGDSGTFNEIPNSSYNAATLADVTNDAKGVCDRVSYCGIPITFGANIEPKKSASGHYSTTLTYTATSKPTPYVPPAPDPEPYVPPTPPAPEPPKWTTNGCTMSGRNYNILDGDNCKYQNYYYGLMRMPIKWSGGKWSAPDSYSYYDYSGGSWILSSYDTYYSGRALPVSAYVPRFARSGYYIRFCKDSTSSGCTDREVDSAFKYGKLGVLVSLKNLGCTANITDDVLSDSSYDAIYAAKTLAEAFGSPCPE